MDEKRQVGPREAWILAVLLWVTTAGITAFELVPASVLSVVSEDLGVSSTVVSWLVSVFILGMVVLSIPAGLLLDRRNNRRVLLATGLGFLVTTILSAIASVIESYSLLMAVRFIGGALNVILWTASVNLVGVAFARSRQGTGIGFLSTSIPGGFALTHLLTPPLLGWMDWELTFVVYGSMTALGALAFFVYTRPYDVQTSVAVPSRSD